ncbi:MAG: cytidine deaminase, partial [Chloroflexi bacterium]|nr:cytidine deaminase [Chloroflexota bacterium]
RQVMGEFATRDALVIVADTKGRARRFTLNQLLPTRFSAAHLRRSRKR